MQRITIPAFFETPVTEANKLADKKSRDDEYQLRAVRINREHISSYYPRNDDDERPSGSFIETTTGAFRTTLTPAEIDSLLDQVDDEEFVRELNKAGLQHLADLVPGTFDDEIIKMLKPKDGDQEN